MGALGICLIVIGVACLILGLIAGAKEIFRRQNEGAAQGLLPTAFLDVIKALLEAPRDKFFTVLGLVLIVLGLGLTGVDLFG
ncbi:MAG: hypothetical protein ACRD2W_09565 [Acidimicrobiales bacterium]